MSLQKISEQLGTELKAQKPNIGKCAELLRSAKTELIKTTFLVVPDTASEAEKKIMAQARNLLELALLYSIHARDIPAFERYWSQLEVYYRDMRSLLSDSPKQRMFYGLRLLSLLAENRIADFHCALEGLATDPKYAEDEFIRHPILLEQALMEGCYNRVWRTCNNVPCKEYMYFVEILMDTVRKEIAGCAERGYQSLPVASAMTLLFFKKPEEMLEFAKINKWTVTNNFIVFAQHRSCHDGIDPEGMMKNVLHYAREIERIV